MNNSSGRQSRTPEGFSKITEKIEQRIVSEQRIANESSTEGKSSYDRFVIDRNSTRDYNYSQKGSFLIKKTTENELYDDEVPSDEEHEE